MKNGKLCFVDSSLFSFYPMLIKLFFFVVVFVVCYLFLLSVLFN